MTILKLLALLLASLFLRGSEQTRETSPFTKRMIQSMFSWRALPPGVKGLLVANGSLFVLQAFLPRVGGPDLVVWLGLTPWAVTQRFFLWQPFTYLFLHGGILHLFFNAFMLWALGREIERSWGTRSFLFFYFLCGAGAALANIAVGPWSTLPVVGASGAVYGLLVAFAMMYPSAVFYLWLIIPMKARYAVILFGVIEFFLSFSGSTSGVSNIAHLGGMVTGYLYMSHGRWRLMGRFWWGRFLDRFSRKKTPPVVMHELSEEVDRLLEKISHKGVGSLTRAERQLMDRYAATKNAKQ